MEHIEGGFIILKRQITRSSLWQMSPIERILAITLICEANYENKKWFDRWQGREIIVKRGELISTHKHLAEKANLSLRSVRTALLNLTRNRFCANITADAPKRAKGYTHLRLPKYEKYQDFTNYDSAKSTIARQRTDIAPTQPRHIPNTSNTSKAVNKDITSTNFIALWKKLCPNLRTPRSPLNEARKTKLRLAVKKHPDKAYWEELLKKANLSGFPTKESYWKPDVDYVLRSEKTRDKILEDGLIPLEGQDERPYHFRQ